MIDNSWIKGDAGQGSAQSKMMRVKIIMTIVLLVAGAALTVAFNGVGSNAVQYKSEGIVVDFGGYQTIWTDVDYRTLDDPVEMLDTVKKTHMSSSFDYVLEDEKLIEVSYNGKVYSNSAERTWDLWTVQKNSFDAQKTISYDISASDYSVVIWAYTSEDGIPAPAVDATATSIYGYAEPFRVVTLSPVCTETVSAVGGSLKIVGTDAYSDYPQRIVEGQKDGSISIVGSYTDPSYEAIMDATPDMVFCDASTYRDIQMADTLRSSDVNSVVLYNGEDTETIIKNVFIAGTSIGYNLGAQAYIERCDYCMEQILASISSARGLRTMVSLSNDPGPWVAGSSTYVNDIVEKLGGTNVFGDKPGWRNITSESIMDLNPECIIIIDSFRYNSNEYDKMISTLNSEWKSTDAYKNGRIYLLCESLGELGSRAGPRFIQLMEIMSFFIDPDAFPEKSGTKCIGDDYLDYLDITKKVVS